MTDNVNMPLSENGSFERIVNSRTEAKRNIRRVWLTKSVRAIIVLLALLLVNVCLWMFRVIPGLASVYVSEILTCMVSFLVGRIYEKFYK